MNTRTIKRECSTTGRSTGPSNHAPAPARSATLAALADVGPELLAERAADSSSSASPCFSRPIASRVAFRNAPESRSGELAGLGKGLGR